MLRKERAKRMRELLLRWHPDKFIQTFGARLKDAERNQIMGRVNEIAGIITNAK